MESRLKNWMELEGLKPSELADNIRVNRATISHILSGRNKPSIDFLEKLLNVYWQNIDPFDLQGQFCDKGKSYRSVIFFQNKGQKNLIDVSYKKIEKRFNKKIETLVWKFDKFYKAESFHQDYYERNFVRYLMYKKSCQREETLKKIWN